MKDGDVGAIPVVLDDGLELVGIVTDRDLVLRGIAGYKCQRVASLAVRFIVS